MSFAIIGGSLVTMLAPKEKESTKRAMMRRNPFFINKNLMNKKIYPLKDTEF